MKETYENSIEYREVPQMTRSEYLKEYADIIEHFDEEKKEMKKVLPIAIIMAIICIIVLLLMFLSGNNILRYSWRVHIYFGQETAMFYFLIPLIPTFPLLAIIKRFKNIKKKENERLKDLEDKKKLCIDIGTYNAEE